MFVATINRNVLSFLVAIIGAEYVLNWLPRGTHRWRKFVKPAELEATLSECGVSVKQRNGVSIDPFTRKFSVTDNLRVNFMLVTQRETRGTVRG